MAPAPKGTPRWMFRFPAEEWSREQDRALIAEGWDRFRPAGDRIIVCAIPAQSETAARAQVARVLRVQPESASAS